MLERRSASIGLDSKFIPSLFAVFFLFQNFFSPSQDFKLVKLTGLINFPAEEGEIEGVILLYMLLSANSGV